MPPGDVPKPSNCRATVSRHASVTENQISLPFVLAIVFSIENITVLILGPNFSHVSICVLSCGWNNYLHALSEERKEFEYVRSFMIVGVVRARTNEYQPRQAVWQGGEIAQVIAS